MASRIRSRLGSILRYGSLPPALLCLLYCSAFVMPLYDYYNIIWSPFTAKQTRMLERIHSKLVNRLPLPYRSRFSLTLTERLLWNSLPFSVNGAATLLSFKNYFNSCFVVLLFLFCLCAVLVFVCIAN